MREHEPEQYKSPDQPPDFGRMWAHHVRAEAELSELIDAAVAAEALIARASALRTDLIDRARRCVEAEEQRLGESRDVSAWSVAERARRTVTAELSAALRIPEITMRAMIAESEVIMHELPATRSALADGLISYRHAQRIVDHATSLPESAREQFEQAVIPVALTQTVAKLDRRARVIRERMHPQSIDERRVSAVERRCIRFEPGRDGMAYLTAHLENSAVVAIHERLTDVATAAVGDDLTLDQARADALMHLLINGVTSSGVEAGIRATVAITVPVLTLMGASDEPGYLHGVGPIDANTARELACTATSFTRILTHPETGAVLSVGRDSYAVPADLKRWLALRDETCRFPGCSRAAKRCDVDHTDDWGESGHTQHDNLAHLCRGHHRLKHQTRWRVKQIGEGSLEWVSPSGHTYRTDPAVTLSA